MKPKTLMFSPSDVSDNRPLSFSKDKARLRKLLEKEYELGAVSIVLSWNGSLSKPLEIEFNPNSGIAYDQQIVDDFIDQVNAKRNAIIALAL